MASSFALLRLLLIVVVPFLAAQSSSSSISPACLATQCSAVMTPEGGTQCPYGCRTFLVDPSFQPVLTSSPSPSSVSTSTHPASCSFECLPPPPSSSSSSSASPSPSSSLCQECSSWSDTAACSSVICPTSTTCSLNRCTCQPMCSLSSSTSSPVVTSPSPPRTSSSSSSSSSSPSAQPLLCPNGSPPPACFVNPCAVMSCLTNTECVVNYCDGFPFPELAACTAKCVSNVCPLPVATVIGSGSSSVAISSPSPIPTSSFMSSLICGPSTPFPQCSDGCNSCACSASEGGGVCTLMACLTLATCTDIDGSQYTTGAVIPKKIAAGSAFTIDFTNICICSAYGRFVCSSIPVPSPTPSLPTPTQPLLCPNGSHPPACFVNPCAVMSCLTNTECVVNYCDGFPFPELAACTAKCVSSSPSVSVTAPPLPTYSPCPSASCVSLLASDSCPFGCRTVGNSVCVSQCLPAPATAPPTVCMSCVATPSPLCDAITCPQGYSCQQQACSCAPVCKPTSPLTVTVYVSVSIVVRSLNDTYISILRRQLVTNFCNALVLPFCSRISISSVTPIVNSFSSSGVTVTVIVEIGPPSSASPDYPTDNMDAYTLALSLFAQLNDAHSIVRQDNPGIMSATFLAQPPTTVVVAVVQDTSASHGQQVIWIGVGVACLVLVLLMVVGTFWWLRVWKRRRHGQQEAKGGGERGYDMTSSQEGNTPTHSTTFERMA